MHFPKNMIELENTKKFATYLYINVDTLILLELNSCLRKFIINLMR